MVETREHEDSHRNHGILRSEHGGPTFADETERLNYTITAYDVDQGTVFKQLSPLSLCAAIAVGTGADKWYLLSNVNPDDVVAAQVSADNAQVAADTAQNTADNAQSDANTAQSTIDTHASAANPHSGSTPTSRTLGFAGPAFTGAGDLSTNRTIAPVFGSSAGTFCEGSDIRLTGAIAVNAVTTMPLPAYTYDNGASGVGATITADVNGALPVIDGVTLTAGNLVYMTRGTSATHNGVYIVTDVGSGSSLFVLTRSALFNTPALIAGSSFGVISGIEFCGAQFCYRANQAITIGTTNLFWYQNVGLQSNYGEKWSDLLRTYNLPLTTTATFVGPGGLRVPLGGSGSSASPSPGSGSGGLYGMLQFNIGTAAGSYAGVSTIDVVTPLVGSFPISDNTTLIWSTKWTAVTLPSASQDFSEIMGFYREIGTSGMKIPLNGICFIVDRTSVISSVNILAACVSGGVSTGSVVDTGIPYVSGRNYRGRIVRWAGSGVVQFYLGEDATPTSLTLVASISSNIPSTGAMGHGVMIYRTAGAVGQTAVITDTVEVELQFPTGLAA